ncbi:hypothetical protein M5W70_18365 [Paenibacillus larvae]|uniref:hypothetical protein n=1 Tax=Paenibacillus larvae TaxID=1464 RepID=UPI0022819030|nr:hypothetical protein [Paenibacillus larvae]MCY9690589.1 hypothetical protein [Paenibacillus larvae]
MKYNPKIEDKGYYYHVNIYHEALLTYEQQLELETGERPCTSDPEDSTDYGALAWYKNGKVSFAEKDWDKIIFRLRDQFKSYGLMLFQGECDWKNSGYIYHIGSRVKRKTSTSQLL